ncbi:MAG TPA: succinate dehydrogenase, hydrophobic membrane anchor protein [Candidatus Dormibacteraeota bacterium]|nr:succinate dehydrogenase, hydrophobic membrane anchor protein [Candidatus Dormibacteraeota bacterium]
MSLRSPLGRVLGTGAAGQGVHHWWMQRLSSLALVPLTIWFLVSLLALPALDHATLIAWIRQGPSALILVLLVLIGARHSQLGVQVVVEDYVHEAASRTLCLVVSSFGHILLAAAGTFAVLKVALAAAP